MSRWNPSACLVFTEIVKTHNLIYAVNLSTFPTTYFPKFPPSCPGWRENPSPGTRSAPPERQPAASGSASGHCTGSTDPPVSTRPNVGSFDGTIRTVCVRRHTQRTLPSNCCEWPVRRLLPPWRLGQPRGPLHEFARLKYRKSTLKLLNFSKF